MITKFKIYEGRGRKKLIYTKEYLDWLLKFDSSFQTNRGIIQLLKKYLRWKLGADRIYNPIKCVLVAGFQNVENIVISSGSDSTGPQNGYRLQPDEFDEFIGFLNNPEIYIMTSKYNI